MRKSTLTIRKWLVRGLVVVGALIGVTACHSSHKKHCNSDADESLSSSESSEISVVEDVYGPPIEEVETVYGPPSYFDDTEVEPEIVDEPSAQSSKSK